jgi:hypothetical protein
MANGVWHEHIFRDMIENIKDKSLVHFILPPENDRVGIDLFKVEMDAIDQLLFAGDADSTEHAARHLTEHSFNDVQPGAMLWREHKLKTLWMKLQPALCLF